METGNIVIMSYTEVVNIAREMFISRLSGREVDINTACQILGVSKDTLGRWIGHNLIHTLNAKEREKRMFDLGYLLTINTQEIKKQYRNLNH